MSVTAVPLRPVSRRALVILWIGILIAIGGGVALAFGGSAKPGIATASGLRYEVIEPGAGPKPTDTDVTLVNYRGTLEDGTEFDANKQVPMPVSGVVPGFSEGLKLMSKGAKYKFWIPPALGYGAEDKRNPDGSIAIPGNSTLVFEVELIDFLPEAVIRQMQMQQMQQQMGMPGGPGGPPPGAVPPAP